METKDLLAKVHRLEIKAKGLTKHIFSGEYHSAFKGRGMAFSEVRNYHFGDEVRTIDWNVTARFNDPFVKVFEEERELTVMLLIDCSGSFNYGSTDKSKRDLIAEVVAILAFSALSNNDKVGAILFSDKVEKYIAPQKGKKQVLYILREFLRFKPNSKKTNISEGLKYLQQTQKKRTITFVLSDFVDENNFMDGLTVARKKHDVVALKVEDPAEYTLPKIGFIQLYNAESGTTTWVNTNDVNVRNKYQSDYIENRELLLKDFKKLGIDTAVLTTDENYIQQLIQLFKKR